MSRGSTNDATFLSVQKEFELCQKICAYKEDCDVREFTYKITLQAGLELENNITVSMDVRVVRVG